MEFEWDEAKSEQVRKLRGFGFAEASRIFEGFTLEWSDVREEWGEARVVAIGEVEGLVLAVVYTDRGSVRRIITARLARRKEREEWQSCVRP